MFDLFGSELPLAARFFIAFLVVLALIGLTAWVVRRFGANRLGGASARGRQPRLAVIDAASVDGRRRLVLIRRDNIEHLLMIGGPTDVVIEPNIVRAAGAREMPRDVTREAMREPVRPAVAPEPPLRPAASAETAWPLQPASEPPPVAAPRPYRAPATEEPWLPPEPGARPRPADSLTGLAAELSTKLTPPEPGAPPVERHEPRLARRPHARAGRTGAGGRRRSQSLGNGAAARSRLAPRAAAGKPAAGHRSAGDASACAKRPAAARAEAANRDSKPRTRAARGSQARAERIEPKPEPEPKVEPKRRAEGRTQDSRPSPNPNRSRRRASDKSLYDNLEEEMASLLGRPSGKS